MSSPTYITERMKFNNKEKVRLFRPVRTITREVWKCKECKKLFFMRYTPKVCIDHEGEEEVCYERS